MVSRDFELIGRIFLSSCRERREARYRLTEQRAAESGTIWHVYGIDGNGGIPYFLEHTFDVEEVALACEAVGMPESAVL